MQRWYIARNNFWFTAAIEMEETPWYLVLLETVVMHVCGWLHYLNWLPTKRLRENYGSVGELFHCFVCMPTVDFVYKYTDMKRIDVPYFALKDQFPEAFMEDDEPFDDDIEITTTNLVDAHRIAEEYSDLIKEDSYESKRKRRKEEGYDV